MTNNNIESRLADLEARLEASEDREAVVSVSEETAAQFERAFATLQPALETADTPNEYLAADALDDGDDLPPWVVTYNSPDTLAVSPAGMTAGMRQKLDAISDLDSPDTVDEIPPQLSQVALSDSSRKHIISALDALTIEWPVTDCAWLLDVDSPARVRFILWHAGGSLDSEREEMNTSSGGGETV